MDVILLEKVRNLGDLGDKVTVRPGYGRNYLVPQGIAVRATKTNIAEFEQRRAELEKRAQESLQQAQARMQSIVGLPQVKLTANASDEGRLFGSIGTREIAQAIENAGVTIAKNEIRLPNGAIREVGEYEIAIQLHGDVEGHLTILVEAE